MTVKKIEARRSIESRQYSLRTTKPIEQKHHIHYYSKPLQNDEEILGNFRTKF